MDSKRLLVIGHVWPEPTSSAAGWRILQLIRLFITRGYHVSFACAAAKSVHSHPLEQEGITCHSILLNNSSFDDLVHSMAPTVVLFDRFMVEEQFGWRVAQSCPHAIRVLDTEDLHFLRQARQEAFKKNTSWDDTLLYNELAKRELAAILRSDLSIMISQEEITLLKEKFSIPPNIISYLPFFEEQIDTISAHRSFGERLHFTFIGNFLHEPNWRTVQLLKTTYWLQIRHRLPTAQLHIYGAYPSQKVFQLHQPKEGFFVMGRAHNARDMLSRYRVLLAPIPFGAGLKGKFIDAMSVGTPSVSTSIGAEGMDHGNWPGYISDDPPAFVDHAVALYTEQALWEDKQALAPRALAQITASPLQQDEFIQQVEAILMHREAHRNSNFLGQVLQSQQNSATKYMSLWIEQKNKD